MRWNWQHPNWPNFRYQQALLAEREATFLRQSGIVVGTVRHVPDEERLSLAIELISTEALKTSEIEGEMLDRASVQSSLRRQFGLQDDNRRTSPREFLLQTHIWLECMPIYSNTQKTFRHHDPVEIRQHGGKRFGLFRRGDGQLAQDLSGLDRGLHGAFTPRQTLAILGDPLDEGVAGVAKLIRCHDRSFSVRAPDDSAETGILCRLQQRQAS